MARCEATSEAGLERLKAGLVEQLTASGLAAPDFSGENAGNTGHDASRSIQEPTRRGEAVTGIEAERQRKDGSRLPVAVSTAPLRDEAGRPDGAVVIIEDISARKRAAAETAARAARMAQEARLLAGIATSRHLARGDLAGSAHHILAAATERLPGCDAALWRPDPDSDADSDPGGEGLLLVGMAGRDGQPLAADDARRGALGRLPLDQGLAAERSIAVGDLAAAPTLPGWLPARFGRAGYGALLLVPIRVAARIEGMLAVLVPSAGAPRGWSVEERGFLASLGDLAALALEAERRAAAMRGLEAAASRAEAANATKSRFLARMSHELRTPLNAIIGFAELLREDDLAAPQRQEFADHVVAAGRELLAALTAVLDHARVEAGTLVLARKRVDPWAMITEAISGRRAGRRAGWPGGGAQRPADAAAAGRCRAAAPGDRRATIQRSEILAAAGTHRDRRRLRPRQRLCHLGARRRPRHDPRGAGPGAGAVPPGGGGAGPPGRRHRARPAAGPRLHRGAWRPAGAGQRAGARHPGHRHPAGRTRLAPGG